MKSPLTAPGPTGRRTPFSRFSMQDVEQVAFHDDIDYAAGKVNSAVQFSPDTTDVYYISVSVYLGNPTHDHSGDYRVRVFDGEEGGTP